MKKEIYNDIKEEKKLYISMCQKYFELFKNNGYAFNLKFIDKKIRKKLNVYIIAEIRDVNNEIKKTRVLVLIYKVLVYDYVTDRLRLCNNNFENAIARILNKLDKTGKLNVGFIRKFKLYLVDKKTFDKYYKDHITIVVWVFTIILGIFYAFYHARVVTRFYYEIFGVELINISQLSIF